MATTTVGTRLTEAHRLDQTRLRSATARDLARMFRVFDPERISESWAALEPALVTLIQARQPLSSRLTGGYYRDFRRAERIAGNAAPALAPTLTVDEIVPNLRIVGPREAWRLTRLARSNVARSTFVNVEGEVTRQVLNGGRTTLTNTVANDPRALGYVRVTDGKACSFCALLASRGPVYSESSVHFNAHHHCGCSGEPVYRRDQPWPGSAEKWSGLYDEVAKNVDRSASDWSAQVRRDFRTAYDAANR